MFFVYLRTEGSQSIVPLVNSGFRPTVVVLQDHGFGGNWGQNRLVVKTPCSTETSSSLSLDREFYSSPRTPPVAWNRVRDSGQSVPGTGKPTQAHAVSDSAGPRTERI